MKFCPDAKIIHIDIDEAEINKLKNSDVFITGDIGEVLRTMLPFVKENGREEWINHVNKVRNENPLILPEANDFLHPINIIKYISTLLEEDSIITTDVGQHQMWTAQAYPVKKPRTLLTSGGLGTMGFGLPAAIGAALANSDKQVICFSGDGSILMNIQELATLSDLNLNVKIIIFINGHLGLVRQQQELFYEKHYIASKFITNPDFVAISKGFGIKAFNLDEENDKKEALKKILSESGPALITVSIREMENVYPMVPPGAPITDMIGGEIYD